MRRLFGVTALAACAIIALAGCQVRAQYAGTPDGAATSPTATSSLAVARPATTHQQRAEADASAILASFVVPAGARQLSAAPAADGGQLRQPFQVPGTLYLVDKASWWLVPGQPQRVLRWERAHLPRRFAYAGDGSAGSVNGGWTASEDQFSLPDVPTVLDWRYLLVEVVGAGRGQTAIRVDAQVAWVPARPIGERVPPVVQVVTVTDRPGVEPSSAPARSVTITDPAKVQRITALVNGLTPPGWSMGHCPPLTGAVVVLTFRTRLGGPALAVVTADPVGCLNTTLTLDGTPQPPLEADRSFTTQVLATAGLRSPAASTPMPR